jgi:DNA-binding transcriptional MocR family regulator
LVDHFGVSRPTVIRAVRDLQADGFLERRQGSGTFLTTEERTLKGYFGMIIPSRMNRDFHAICGGNFVDQPRRRVHASVQQCPSLRRCRTGETPAGMCSLYIQQKWPAFF